MRNKFKGKIAFLVLGCIAMFFAVSAMVMLLWNCILPIVIGVKVITYWQAMGILVLSKILFGGFGGRSCHGKNKFRRLNEERMNGMSAEEKEKLKEIWKQRCERGFFGKNN